MEWAKVVAEYVQQITTIPVDQALAEKIISVVDLTSLNDNDTESSTALLCEKARTGFGDVASVCVWPKFLRLVADEFAATPIHAGTVANFPGGNTVLDDVLIGISRALMDGADEIDVVFPYARYLTGEKQYAQNFVATCKATCGDEVILKVILETGALGDLSIIADAAFDVITAGADFIKTSTGKIPAGPTFEAAAAMLLVIRQLQPQLKRHIGFKVSGGIKEIEKAAQYMQLAELIMDRDWLTAETFRIGSSKLVDEILKMEVKTD